MLKGLRNIFILAMFVFTACAVPISPIAKQDALLKMKPERDSVIFIASIEMAEKLDMAGLVMLFDGEPIIRAVSKSEAKHPTDIPLGGIWSSLIVSDVRPDSKGYVVFSAKPANGDLHSIFVYSSLAATGNFLSIGNRGAGAWKTVPAPTDGKMQYYWKASKQPPSFFGLAADVKKQGIYYLGDVTFTGEIKDGYPRTALVKISAKSNLEGAKSFLLSYGIDVAEFTDLSGLWKEYPEKDFDALGTRSSKDPLP